MMDELKDALQFLMTMCTVLDQRLIPEKYRARFVEALEQAERALKNVECK